VALGYAQGVFREARSGDFEAVARLYAQLHPSDPSVNDGSDRRAFTTIVSSELLRLFVLELDGAVVATTYLNVIPNMTRGASPYAVIENVVVEESLRGRGLGQEIMRATLEAAWAAGCYKSMLMTGRKDPLIHSFYESCGFSSTDKSAFVARPI
jgi:GNAT superfamily N-acetyltransferase